MISAYIALGSNISPRLSRLQTAGKLLTREGDVDRAAPVYRSAPYGVEDQPAFFNTAVRLKTHLSPVDLLDFVKTIEVQVGRQQRYRWGPREIDLDIIFYGQEIVQQPRLTIPHADYKNRRFVLQPLTDIEPAFIPPDARQSLSELLQLCPDLLPLKLYRKNWMIDGI